MNRTVCLAIVTAATFLPDATALAQDDHRSSVTIESTVRDVEGATLSGFSLVFTPQNTEKASDTQTRIGIDHAGRFRVDLAPGVYFVTTAPPLCRVDPVLWSAASSGTNDIVLQAHRDADQPAVATAGVVGNTLETIVPKQAHVTFVGPAPVTWGLTWERPTNFRQMIPGGHLVRTELCDPRLSLQTSQPTVPPPAPKDER